MIYLVRHGDYNYREIASATVGQGLTARGREQAQATATWLAGADSDIRSIQSSDFTRAAETAAILATAFPLANLEVGPKFRDVGSPEHRCHHLSAMNLSANRQHTSNILDHSQAVCLHKCEVQERGQLRSAFCAVCRH